MTPQIIAHRGASYLAPENTLTAFKKAMEIGADGVEMDVQQTIDAGLVIHHDYMIDLHTDISGKIYDMTMGDLKELDFGSWKDAIYQDEKIATLQEAMELCKQMPECTVHLELKSTMNNDPDFVPRVLEVLQQTEMVEQVILVSFNHALLRQAKQLMPELRVGALVYGELESMLLPPPIIWKDLGLTNGIDDMEAMDAALPESAADEENCSWMTRWMSDKVSMLRASFPGESLNEIYKNLMAQRDLPAYIRSLSGSAVSTTPPTKTPVSLTNCTRWASRCLCGRWTRKILSAACCAPAPMPTSPTAPTACGSGWKRNRQRPPRQSLPPLLRQTPGQLPQSKPAWNKHK